MKRCVEFNLKKVLVKILQGSVVTQTVLGGPNINPAVANYLLCVYVPKIMNVGCQ